MSDLLDDYYRDIAHYGGIAKPEPHRKTNARTTRARRHSVSEIREYVFALERNICRCCRARAAESMHEIQSRGAGGKVSKKNSVAVCGQLVGVDPSCHTYLQHKQIVVGGSIVGAEAELIFTPRTDSAAAWMKIAPGEQIESRPMREHEAAE